MLIMLGVAGSFSILLPEPPASSTYSKYKGFRVARQLGGGGKLWRYGLLAGQANNLSGLNIGIQTDGERLIINFSGSNDISMCTCNNKGFAR